MRHRIGLPLLSLLVALTALPVVAQSDETSSSAEAQKSAQQTAEVQAHPGPVVKVIHHESEAPSMRGLIAVRDAETGELRAPTNEEWARLAPSVEPLNRSDAGLVETHYADGTVGVVLDGRFQSMMMAHKPEGQDHVQGLCTHDAQTATHVLLSSPQTAKTDEENSDVR